MVVEFKSGFWFVIFIILFGINFLIRGDELMNEKFKVLLMVVGCVMLVIIFLMSVVGKKIFDFLGIVEYMKVNGVFVLSFMFVGVIVFLLIGGVLVVFGFKVWIGVMLLVVFLILVMFFFYGVWNYDFDLVEF